MESNVGQIEWTEVKGLPTHDLFRWKDQLVLQEEAPDESETLEGEPLDPDELQAVMERFTAHRV